MDNTLRWTLLGLLVAGNAVTSVILNGTWIGIAVSVLTGLAALALVIEYLARGRRRPR